MIASGEVTIERATQADAVLLSNLLELYAYDLSEVFSFDVGSDGRFGYSKLPLYWADPERRFAFLIQASGRIAGFAFATRGSPMSDNPEDLDVAEFFVIRRHRRSGVGRRAARLLWDSIPGQWIVRVSESNRPALPFWESVIREYTRGEFSEAHRPGGVHRWRVFSFRTREHARLVSV
jgi:predicted acetyltransferase